MATRFYFASTGSPAVSPTINAGGEWEHANTLRRPLRATLGSTALSTGLYAPDTGDHLVDGDAMVIQFVSDEQLAAQTISAQALKWQFQILESNAGNNLFMALKVFLVSGDGGTIKDTILAIKRDGTELATGTRTNRGDSGTSTSVDADDGDRIVVEFGWGGTPTAAGGTQGHNADLRYGENASSGDLPEDNAETGTTFRPWLEFANDLTFKSSDVSGSAAGTGTASATAAARRATSASTSGAASASGIVAARRGLVAAAIAGIATAAATVGKVAAVTAAVAGSATVTASVAAKRAVSASANGVATVSASVAAPSSLVDFVTDWSSIPSHFTQVTGGSGSISVSDNELVLSKPSTSDYAYLYLSEALPKDQDWIIYLPGVKYSNTALAYQVLLVNEAGGPTADTITGLNGKLAGRISQGVPVSSRVIGFARWNTGGTRTEWNNAGATWGSAPQTGGHVWNADDRTDVFVQNDGANERFRFGIVGAAQPHNDTTNPGQLLTTLTDWTDWSATRGLGDDTYLVIGMPANDSSSGDVTVGRGLKFSISDPADRTWVLVNAQDSLGDGWVVRRAWGCGAHDTGILFVPEDRSTIVIDKGGAGEFDEDLAKDKSWAYGPDGNLYGFWDGATPGGGDDYKVAVGIFASGPGGSFNKGTSTPIVPLGGVGEPAPDGTERAFFPYAFWDATDAEWKLFCGTLTDTSPTEWGITYYTNPSQDPRSGTWTYQGLILSASGSGWRERGVNGPVVFHHNGKWEVWVAGADNSASVVWTQGRFYGSNLGSLTEDANNPRQDISGAAQQLSGSVTDSNTITVGDTTGFTPGAFVVIDDDATVANYVRARIRKILSSTQIELFNRITIGANAWVFQAGTGSVQAQSIVQGEDGAWYLYTTPFAFERGSGASVSAYCETAGVAQLDDIESGQAVMIHDLIPAPSPIMNPNGGQRSLENPALINPVLTHTITVAGTSTVTATITKAGSTAAVSASAAGTSTVSATIAATRAVPATSAGVASVTSSIAAQRAVSASAAGTASVTAVVSKQGTQSVSASVVGSATVSAVLTAKRAVTAAAAGTASATAEAAAKRAGIASAAGQAAVSASVQRQGQSSITASAAGTSTVAASVTPIRAVSVSSAGTSSVAAEVHAARAVVASVTGSATVTAAFAPGARHFQVTTTGSSAVTATIAKVAAAVTGKYAAEHAAAYRDVLAAGGGDFASEHSSALRDVGEAGA